MAMQNQQLYPASRQGPLRQSRRSARQSQQTSFSWTDPTQVAANTQGQVTAEQIKMLKQQPGWIPAGCLAYLTFIALAPTFFLYQYSQNPLSLLLLLVPLSLTILSFTWPFIRNDFFLRTMGPIVTAQGEVIWQQKQYVARTPNRRLKIAQKTLDPPPPGPYHFYYLANSDILLSAQPISTNTGMLAYPNLLAGSGLPGHEQARLALQEALFSSLNFTQYDLEANRMGALSEAQRSRLSRIVSSGVIFSLIGVPAGAALSTASAVLWHQACIAIIGIGLSGLCAFNLLVATPRKRAEIQQGAVQYKESYVRAREVTGADDSPTTYYYDIDNLTFGVNYEAYKALVSNTRYRVYYLPYMHTLLSIEPLEAPPRI